MKPVADILIGPWVREEDHWPHVFLGMGWGVEKVALMATVHVIECRCNIEWSFSPDKTICQNLERSR